MMWKHIFGYGNTRVCLCQDTGAMNRLPTPGGVLVGYFVGVSSIIGRLSAAVGLIYRARISEYTHKMTNGNTCVVKWIHVYNNVEMRIR